MAGECQLAEIATIQQGRYLPPAMMAERCSEATPIPVWGANGVIGFTDSPSYEQAVPLVTCRGNGCGLVQWTGEPAHVSNNAMAIIPTTTEPSDTHYLYYSLLSTDFADVTTGSAQPQITVSHLSRKLVFWNKQAPERAAIAHILGTLDDKIELNRRTNETLEAIAQAVFKSWFVGFDPVRAKMAGRRPFGMDAATAALFPDSFQDSPLGEIPAGWKVERLADHFDAVKGVSYKGSGLSDTGMPLHNLNSIYEGGGYKYEGIKRYNGEYADRHVVRPGDVIVANTEQGHDRLLIGYAAIVPRLFGERGIASHHIYRLRPGRNSNLTALFLCHLLNSPRMHDIVSGYANGTTVNMLPLDGVQRPQIVAPPGALITTFDGLAIQIEARREEMVAESRTLASIRDALLPKLLSGQVQVKDAEKLLESTV